MRYFLTIIFLFCFSIFLFAQDNEETYITFYINKFVKNADEDYAVEIIDLWREYLLSREFVRPQNSYWDQSIIPIPDNSLVSLLIDLNAARRNNRKVQNSIIGIQPVQNDHYMLKTMFTSITDSTDQVNLHYITTVYAKKIGERYRLVNGTQYYKELWKNQKVGSVNYIIHPEHNFSLAEAKKMNDFNNYIASEFQVDPLEFDYVVTNNTDQLSNMMAYDYFEFSYQPVASGGMADTKNSILYAGNNSAHYPHEVVHLYTYNHAGARTHHWVDEGIAAYYGGSTGYTLDWHLQKLRDYLIKNPDFKIDNLADLQKNIPNGEYMTDFRYVIGGFVIKKIIEAEGMQGVFEALKIDRSDEAYFQLLEEKLGVSEEGFTEYLNDQLLRIPAVSSKNLYLDIYKTK